MVATATAHLVAMSKRQIIIFLTCTIVALGVLAGASTLWMRSGSLSSSDGIRTSGEALVGGPFSLTDHTGARVTQDDFLGRPMMLYFGYTFCPDVCPTSLQVLAVALEEMGEEADVIQPVFVTIDPARDTVEQMAEYVGYFGDDFIGLTGTDEEIADIARTYRVYYGKVDGESEDDYLMDHSSIFYLMGADGKFVKHFSYTTDPEQLALDIAAHL